MHSDEAAQVMPPASRHPVDEVKGLSSYDKIAVRVPVLSLGEESKMSTTQARGPQSYENEQLLLAMLPELLRAHGFSAVATSRQGQMKFVDARDSAGAPVRFWLKQGWTDRRNFCAIQFGMFDGPSSELRPDAEFTDHVDNRVERAMTQGAKYALLVQMLDGLIHSCVALEIGDVAIAFRRQIARWPKRARNSKTPTLYFDDQRNLPDAECASAVLELALPLSAISGLTAPVKGVTDDSKKVTAEVEVRMRQRAFRLRVGERHGWKCAVSGSQVQEVLDAAHLPGKNWRSDNQASDGILLRADLHRLLDCGLAELREGKFWIAVSARVDEYVQYHDRSYRGR